VEESGRRESFAPTYGVHINPVSKGKQIPLCSSGQGCTHEGGPFQRPPIDCTDLNYRTLKNFHSSSTSQLHSWAKWQTNPPKIRLKKIVKLTGNCNDLTHFEYEVRSMTRNGNYMNLLKLAWKNLWQPYFWLVLAICNHSAVLWQLLYWNQYSKNLWFLP
jgi:hypothetical protein